MCADLTKECVHTVVLFNVGWLSVYSLLSSHSDCDRTFYCLKTMLIMLALKQQCNFTRRYSVPRTVKWLRDLPLSGRGTGADLQRKQHLLLRLGWVGLSCLSLFPLSGNCTRVRHSSQHLCKASAPAFGCATPSRKAKTSGRAHTASDRPLPIAAVVLGPTRYAVCWKRTH